LDKKTAIIAANEEADPMTTLTISLPESLKAFIDAQLATKGYGNVSEYVRSLLREAQAKEKEARLEALLLEGLASERIPLDAEFRKRVAVKAEQILDRYKDRPRP
jgi:antitoxin ParD1/3/4